MAFMTSPAFADAANFIHRLIRGTIIEEVVTLKIRTRDGNVFVYTMDEIAKMSREPVMRMRGYIGVQSLALAGQFYNASNQLGVGILGMMVGEHGNHP